MRASPNRICSIEDCNQPTRARGWCFKHWYRWRRHGNPEIVLVTRHEGSLVERFWAKVDKTETCWNWTGTINSGGYGSYRVSGKIVGAHRFAYETVVGSIPAELEIDHRCHNTRCVNPAHLRLVTPKQNCENRLRARSDSSSAIRGVSWVPERRLWLARVFHHGKWVYREYFQTENEADAAAITARNQFFTHNDADRLCMKVQ